MSLDNEGSLPFTGAGGATANDVLSRSSRGPGLSTLWGQLDANRNDPTLPADRGGSITTLELLRESLAFYGGRARRGGISSRPGLHGRWCCMTPLAAFH